MIETTRDDADRSMACYAAFSLTLKVVTNATGHQLTMQELKALWKCVQDVAAGEVTLNNSPGESMIDRALLPAQKAHIQNTRQSIINRDRATALAIVRAAEGFVTDSRDA